MKFRNCVPCLSAKLCNRRSIFSNIFASQNTASPWMGGGLSRQAWRSGAGGNLSAFGPFFRSPCGRCSMGTVDTTQAHAVGAEPSWMAAAFLGLTSAPANVGSLIEVHDLLLKGLPVAAVEHLRAQLQQMRNDPRILSTLSLARRRPISEGQTLTPLQSNLVWTFARLLARSTQVLGDQSAAERWMVEPVMALERRPIELMTTCVGVQAIDDHLTRMEFGVYS